MAAGKKTEPWTAPSKPKSQNPSVHPVVTQVSMTGKGGPKQPQANLPWCQWDLFTPEEQPEKQGRRIHCYSGKGKMADREETEHEGARLLM